MIPFIRNVHKSKIYRQKWLPQAGVGVGITANRHKASLEEGNENVPKFDWVDDCTTLYIIIIRQLYI